MLFVLLVAAAPAHAANDAVFKWYVDVPDTMEVNTTASVGVRMRNTGTTTWTRAGEYKLGARCPNIWGLNRVYLSASDSVPPDTAKTFRFVMTAPSVPGAYCFQWQMIDSDAPVGTRFFGERSTLKTIVVTAPEPDAYPVAGPDSTNLQDLLHQGGRIALAPGTYDIDTGLVIEVNGTTLTSFSTSSPATLRATSGLQQPILQAVGKSNFTISHLVFDGNKSARRGVTPACVGNRSFGTNIELIGSSEFIVYDIDSINARCGTALGIVGSRFDVSSSRFSNNGYPDAYGDDLDPWSDGITLGTCDWGYVHHNTVTDSTDIGIVSGGGKNCKVEDNVIQQTNVRAFAGLAVHNFPSDGAGNHSGSVFQSNTIQATPGTLDFGISVGHHPWVPTLVSNGGKVLNNTVSGGVVNLAIDGFAGGEVTGNTLSSPGGGLSHRYPKCFFTGNYTAAHVVNTTLQSGYETRSFHSPDCEPEDDCTVNPEQKSWCAPDPDPIPPAPPTCSGALDYRGDNCSDWKRYQCNSTTDCAANNCTYNGASCFWMCHWQPGAETCEHVCDAKAITPCSSRTTESFCSLGWGCTWGTGG